jgi:hypothetical protein
MQKISLLETHVAELQADVYKVHIRLLRVVLDYILVLVNFDQHFHFAVNKHTTKQNI